MTSCLVQVSPGVELNVCHVVAVATPVHMVADDPASFCIDALKLRDSLLVLVTCPEVGAKSGTFIDTLAGLFIVNRAKA